MINGEAETGITTMYMGEGLDTGDILLVQRTPIGPEETAGELFDRLAPMGADCLKKTVRALEEKRITPVKQDEQKATYAPMLDKTMAELDFTRPAAELHNLIRDSTPGPWPIPTMATRSSRSLPPGWNRAAGNPAPCWTPTGLSLPAAKEPCVLPKYSSRAAAV